MLAAGRGSLEGDRVQVWAVKRKQNKGDELFVILSPGSWTCQQNPSGTSLRLPENVSIGIS